MTHHCDEWGYARPLTEKQCENFLKAILFSCRQRIVMRWGRENISDEELSELRESDMEHVGAGVTLIFLIRSFLENIDDAATEAIDWCLLYELFICHDTPEIFVGDKRTKTEAFKIKEEKAEILMIRLARKFGFSCRYADHMDRYYERREDGSKSSPECNLAKTVDEMIGLAIIIQSGRFDMQKRTFAEAHEFFNTYTRSFPALKQIGHYMVDYIDAERRKQRIGRKA